MRNQFDVAQDDVVYDTNRVDYPQNTGYVSVPRSASPLASNFNHFRGEQHRTLMVPEYRFRQDTSVQRMINSGKNVAKLGLIGFFPACYLGVAAMTVASAGTILAAGFVGGMAIYFARNLILNVFSNCLQLSTRSKFTMQLVDMGSLLFAGAAGAYLLGLAIYPVVICVALGLATLALVNLCLDFKNTIDHVDGFDTNCRVNETMAQTLGEEAVTVPSFGML